MRLVALCALFPLAAFAQTPAAEPASPAVDVPVGGARPAAVAPAAAVPAAEPPAPAPAPAPRPTDWSIGAGVAFEPESILLTPTSISSIGLYIPPPQIPSVVASLERRLSGRSWLVLGVNGWFARDRQDVAPGEPGVPSSDMYAVAVSAGVRHVVTPAGAPVDVSILVLAEGGVSSRKGDAAYYDGGSGVVTGDFHESGWRAGASFGLAVDRELTRGVSLRVATPLLDAAYASASTTISGQPTLDGNDFSAGVVIAPRLELRLAF